MVYSTCFLFSQGISHKVEPQLKIDHHEFIGEGGDEKDLTGQHRWQTIPGKGGDETSTLMGKWLIIVN